jgi:hypothetical protein
MPTTRNQTRLASAGLDPRHLATAGARWRPPPRRDYLRQRQPEAGLCGRRCGFAAGSVRGGAAARAGAGDAARPLSSVVRVLDPAIRRGCDWLRRLLPLKGHSRDTAAASFFAVSSEKGKITRRNTTADHIRP